LPPLCTPAGQSAAAALHSLVDAGLDRHPLMPWPGGGDTLSRWRTLAAVGAHDLALAKLFEGHTDALAILHEAGIDQPGGDDASSDNVNSFTWGTWCAEPPDARLQLRQGGSGWYVDGRKSWCSGARTVSHALVSCWNEAGEAVLAAVEMGHAGIAFDAIAVPA
jgi:alkylation response protein AidB-like acyl-CoA dehydrogenase